MFGVEEFDANEISITTEPGPKVVVGVAFRRTAVCVIGQLNRDAVAAIAEWENLIQKYPSSDRRKKSRDAIANIMDKQTFYEQDSVETVYAAALWLVQDNQENEDVRAAIAQGNVGVLMKITDEEASMLRFRSEMMEISDFMSEMAT